jgi:acetyltransferase
VDVIGDATHERYETAVRYILQDENVDAAIVILSPQAMTDILETAMIIPRIRKDIEKPVLCSFMGIVDVSEGSRYLEEHGIPNYAFPEAAVRSLAAMVDVGNLISLKQRQERTRTVDRNRAAAIIKKKLANRDQCYLGEHEANDILRCYGFPLLKSTLITEKGQIDGALEKVGTPVAMKVMSPAIVHKFDVGGVLLKIKSAQEARGAYEKIIANVKKHNPTARIEGVLMEQMARKGVEVILGAVRDPKFGPLCMFGLGGTFVEALKDVTFRLAPMWEASAKSMIESIKTYRILQGVRGAPPSDIEAIKDCIIRLSQMLNDHIEIAEMDINPLIVYPEGEGCVVADSRMMLRDEDV